MHKRYHDQFYGFPLKNDHELFGRLILEINQAGLSWETILKKEDAFREAFDDFDMEKVAAYQEGEVERLMANQGIIRNRRKIEAAIFNAQRINEIKQEFGSFASWLDRHLSCSETEWIQLFRSNFRFTGKEIVREFLMSTSYIKGAHDEDCPVFDVILQQKPNWLNI